MLMTFFSGTKASAHNRFFKALLAELSSHIYNSNIDNEYKLIMVAYNVGHKGFTVGFLE